MREGQAMGTSSGDGPLDVAGGDESSPMGNSTDGGPSDDDDDPDYRYYYPGPSLSNWSYAAHPDVPAAMYNLGFLFLLFILTFGLYSNLAVVRGWMRTPSLRTPNTAILMNLVLSNLLIICVGVPIDGTAAVMHGWRLGQTACEVTGFTLTLGGMSALYSLTALSAQQWLAVHGYGEVDVNGNCFNLLVIAAVWASSLAMVLPPLVGWGRYVPEVAGFSCSSSWLSWETFGYNLYFLILGFWAPLLMVMVPAGVSVWNKMQQDARQMLFLRTKQRALKRRNKMARMVFSTLAVFIVAWTPYALISNLQMVGYEPQPIVTVLPVICAKFSTCSTPVIYVLTNSMFRDAVNFPRFLSRERCKAFIRVGALLRLPSHRREEVRNADGKKTTRKKTGEDKTTGDAKRDTVEKSMKGKRTGSGKKEVKKAADNEEKAKVTSPATAPQPAVKLRPVPERKAEKIGRRAAASRKAGGEERPVAAAPEIVVVPAGLEAGDGDAQSLQSLELNRRSLALSVDTEHIEMLLTSPEEEEERDGEEMLTVTISPSKPADSDGSREGADDTKTGLLSVTLH